MVIQRTLLSLLLFVFTAIFWQQSAAAPTANIDRSVIAIDESFTLSIRINETSIKTGPELSSLETDFHVLANSQSSRHMLKNGRSESWTEWTISLIPKRQGQLSIPAIAINGQYTQAISINVLAAVPQARGELRPIYLESEIDKDTVYVQQQLIYTLRIYQSIQLDNMNITEPEFDDAAMEKLEQNTFQRRIQNTPYRVHELRYAIFPQKTGELIIPELVFTANETVSRRSMFTLPGQGRPIRKSSQQHSVQVVSSPDSFPGDTWLPAKSLQVTESWSGNPDDIRVGDSITRTVTINADGLLHTQLPPYNFPSLDGARFYPDKGKGETTATNQGVISTRIDSAAIIPTKAGTIELPEIRISWWDINQNKLQQALIPASKLTVKSALIDNQSSGTPLAIDHSNSEQLAANPVNTSTNNNIMWRLIAVLLALLWLITLLQWWRLKKKIAGAEQPQASTSESVLSERQAFKTLTQVCQNNKIKEARPAIIQWAKAFWPDKKIHSLQDIRHCCHTELGTALLQLDNLLYGNSPDNSQWNGEGVLSIIQAMRNDKQQKQAVERQLPPLYSN